MTISVCCASKKHQFCTTLGAMFDKFKKFVKNRVHHAKGKADRLPADSSSAPPAPWAKSTPGLTQSSTPRRPQNSGPYPFPKRNRVYNGASEDCALRMEKRRTGSPYAYTQSLGDVRITNPEFTSASSNTSPALTSSNLSNYDPSPISDLMTAAYHRKPSPPSESNLSAVPNSSRVSVADDFSPMNDDLTAAVFTTQVSDESEEPEEHLSEAQSPRSAMNPLRLNPPCMPMVSTPRQESCSPLDGQENRELAAAELPLPMNPRQSSRPGFLPSARDQEGVRLLPNSTPSRTISRRSSSVKSYLRTREDAVASDDHPIIRRPSSSSGPYRSTPLGEHLRTRIRQRRFSGRHGPLTTAEFPKTLQTLGPYARFPKFTRSSAYNFPHDDPFLFPNEGVPGQDRDLDSGMSANLTRPAITQYEIYRKSNSSSVFVDYPDEPDKDIYQRPVKLHRPPMTYMHTRYPRHLPSQLVVGAPFPSRGPVSSPPFCRRVSHSFVSAPRRRRLTKARVGPVEHTLKRIKSRRQSQLQSYGSTRPASRSQGVRKYHAFMYNSMLQSGRKWNDYTIIESSRENSIGGAAATQSYVPFSVGVPNALPTTETVAIIARQNATSGDTISSFTSPTMVREAISVGNNTLSTIPDTATIVPLQTQTSGSTTSSPVPNQSFSTPQTPRQRSLVIPHQASARLRHRQAARLASLGHLAALWLQQNNTIPSPQEFVNVP